MSLKSLLRGAVIRKYLNFLSEVIARKISFGILAQYIPLVNRMRGPYGKLWTEFFPSFYGPSAERAGHENKEGKNEDP